MATAAKDVDTLPPSESAPGRKRPRPGRKNATAPDPLRIEIAKALEIENIPQMQPLFPGLPRKTDFRKLAINLNLRLPKNSATASFNTVLDSTPMVMMALDSWRQSRGGSSPCPYSC